MEKGIGEDMNIFNYDGMMFSPKSNTENGEVSNLTIFKYKQKGNVLSGEYASGDIVKGTLLGQVLENGELEFYYNHTNIKNEQRVGKCKSIPKILESGKIELYEKWQWLNGDMSEGESVIIQI
ncbi:MAG: n-acetylglutamate synthase [Clostridium sp.]|uniref:n-acetylglutamate synthase n=1 Tax=Clostridium sp. TaxID=1506 RepID=UPI003F3D50E4